LTGEKPIRRREFIRLAAAAAATCRPLSARAQPSGQIWHVGFLGAASAAKYTNLVDALRAGLRDFGYIEGKNIVINFRWAEGNNQRLPELATELVNLQPDVLVTHGTPGTSAAKHATTTIPIVMAVSGDAIATGLIKSLAQSGCNVTGTTFFGPELAAKRLELIREAIPNISQVAVLVNPDNPVNGPVLKAMDSTAASLSIKLQQFLLRRSTELDDTFAKIAARKCDGIAVFEDAITIANAATIAQLAVKQRLPLTGFAELATVGGLIGYGANIPNLFRRAGYFADRILHGAKPNEIPVEQPTEFDLVINSKTAKALGLTLPAMLLATADKVIE
jgi:putative tryptophan/tyrosine transport system substrate-binding protein